MIRLSFQMFAIAMLTTLATLTSAANAGMINITFDELPSGVRTGTHYKNQGVMFFDSNGSRGSSTAIRMEGGLPVTAAVSNFGTSVTLPNVLVPSAASNNDIWVQFYDSALNRTTADFVQIQNDAEGFPKIAIEAYDRFGALIERTSLVGARQFVAVAHPDIYLAKFVSNPATPGNIGVDNFSYILSGVTPEPSTTALHCSAGVCGVAWGLLRRRKFAGWIKRRSK